MAIIHSCCCKMPLKKGCVACGIYTLIYYTIMVVGGTFQVDTMAYPPNNGTNFVYSLGQFVEASYPITIGYVICSVLTVLASVFLMMGLFVNNRLMLLPWIIMIVITTFADFIYTIFLICTVTISIEFVIIVILDFFICILNMYCILCVVSQYQVYKSGTWREDILVQVPCNREVTQYDVGNGKRSVTFIGNGCADKMLSKNSSGLNELVGQKTDGICDVQKSDEVPLKCINSNGVGVTSQTLNFLQVDSAETQDTCITDTGLWTEGICNSKRRRSSAKHVQFRPNTSIIDGESSTEVLQVSEGETVPHKLLETRDTAEDNTSKPSSVVDPTRKVSFSTTVNESSPLLNRQPNTTNL